MLAKERGVTFGRQPKLMGAEAGELRRWRKLGELIRVLMKGYDLSKASIYRLLAT